MPKPVNGSSRYIAGLDGLRAIAVLAVIAYHLGLPFAPGGLLGVGVFFVLSGYLITDLLLAEWSRSSRIDLKQFWLRRARRLLPALIVTIGVVTAWLALFDPTDLKKFSGDAIAALLYVSNWWFIFHHVSYFQSFGLPSPFGHLWSLAVEEQFYLIWPTLLILALFFLRRRGRILLFTIFLAIVSALLMAFIYHPGVDPSRVYYGTDTRAFSLLFGAALAMMWPSRQLSASVSVAKRIALDVVGVAGLVVIVYMMLHTNEYETFLYRGGMVLVSLATCMTIASVVHPASTVGRVMGMQPLRWIGVRSYGIYLWHYPVIVLTSPVVNTGGVQPLRATLQVVASILLAALSWNLIEEPIRQWGRRRNERESLDNATKTVRMTGRHRKKQMGRRMFAPAWIVFIAAAGISMFDLVPAATASSDVLTTNPSSSVAKPKPLTVAAKSGQTPSTTVTNGHTGSVKPLPTVKKDPLPNVATSSTQGATGTTSSNPPNTGNTTSGSTPAVNIAPANVKPIGSGAGISTIGDSVMVDATPYLQKLLPGIVCDGLVGRQFYQAPAAIASLKAKGELGSQVVIELGTNGPFTKPQLVSLLQSLASEKRIVLVTTRVPRPWQDIVNTTITEVAKSFPNVTLVDWYSISANHNNYFYPDGVHLNPVGSLVYAEALASALQH